MKTALSKRPTLVVGTCFVIWAIVPIYFIVGLGAKERLFEISTTFAQWVHHMALSIMLVGLLIGSAGLWYLRRWGTILYIVSVSIGVIGNMYMSIAGYEDWRQIFIWGIFLIPHINISKRLWQLTG